MIKLNKKTVSSARSLGTSLSILLLTTLSNFSCIKHEEDVLDFSRSSVNEFIVEINNIKNKSQLSKEKFAGEYEYKRVLNSLNHMGIDFKKLKEIADSLYANKDSVLELSKKHNIDLNSFYKKDVMDILDKKRNHLTPNEISFLNDFKKLISLDQEQIEKIKDLVGTLKKYDHLFSSLKETESLIDRITPAMLWFFFAIFFMAVCTGAPESLMGVVFVGLFLLNYYR